MNTNVPMRIPNDAFSEFVSRRITDIKKAFVKNLLPTSSYALAVDNREDAINAFPLEYIKQVDDLVDAMESQSYELQIACYQQGLVDGCLTLGQLGQFVYQEESA